MVDPVSGGVTEGEVQLATELVKALKGKLSALSYNVAIPV